MEIRTSSDTRSRPDLPTRRPPRGLVRNVTSRLYYVPRSPDASVDVLNYITSRPYKTFRLSGFSTVHYMAGLGPGQDDSIVSAAGRASRQGVRARTVTMSSVGRRRESRREGNRTKFPYSKKCAKYTRSGCNVI